MRLALAIIAVVMSSVIVAEFASAEPPVAYRRVHVPADNPAAWPRGEKTYLPIETSEFTAWVEAANAPPAAAAITKALYEARFEGGDLSGSGSWHAELIGRGTARIKRPSSSPQLLGARWRGDAAIPVRVGWWPIQGTDQIERALEVSQSGDLEFDWRARATAGVVGSPEYSLSFPPAARSRFTLDLPAGKQPVFADAAVLESPARPEDGGRWIVALAPDGPMRLRLHDAAPSVPSAASPKVHQELEYSLSQRGVELRARLRIDAGETEIQKLRLKLPQGWKLVAASCGERSLLWRNVDDRGGITSLHTIVELGNELPNGTREISLLCWGPPVIGESLHLPMLSVDDTFWTTGTIHVAIDDALEPGELMPVECIQTAVDAVETDGGSVRRMSFRAFAPEAAVDVVLVEHPARGFVRMGTSLEVGNPRVTSRTIAEMSVERGNLRRLSATLQAGWVINSVETIPAEALGEWYVDRMGERHVLDVQLQQAVTPDRPVRVVVTGRLANNGIIDPQSVAKLNPLSWRGLSTTRNLLQLRAAEQFELEVVADLQYLAASSLSAPERALFAMPDDAPVCDLAANPPAAAIRLAPKKGTYDATIQVDAELRQDRLQSTYRVECRPRGSGVDHVLVYLSQPTPRPLEWFQTDSAVRLSAERMPESDPRLGGLPRGGELWLIDLGRLYVRPFAITAQTTGRWTRRDRVPLAALPDAASQQGRVTVSSGAVEMPTIVAEGMSPTSLPVESSADGSEDSAAVRAVYRFQPTRFYDAGQAAQLWMGPAAMSAESAKLVATHLDVDSRYSADGSGVHRVTYHLQNFGAKSLELTPPPGVRLESARVDGNLVTATSQDMVALTLPERSKLLLELELTNRQPLLRSGQRVSAPLPSGAVTIVAGRWRVSLPHGFEALDGNVTENAAPTWRVRWFGPLARRNADRPFNPFGARDWNAMWAGLSRAASTPAVAETPALDEERPLPTGWRATEIDFVAGPPAAITIAHRPATSAIALALFLACAIVPRLVFHARGVVILLLAIAAAAVSVFLSAIYAPLGAAATLGFCAAALWHAWFRISLTSGPALGVVFMLCACSPVALADEPAAAIEQVLVPVDAAGKPAGTKYFVSSDLLRRLIRGPSTDSSGDGWLIADMRCDGELVPGTGPQPGLRAANWALTLDVQVFSRDAVLRLPLRKDEADWPATASVDGIPAALEWDASGRGCAIRVIEPGRREISVEFLPHVEASAAGNSIALALPKVSGTAISVAAPAALAEIRGRERPYVRHAEANRAVWRSELDDAGRLVATWDVPLADATFAASRGVDQFSSMQIQPDALYLVVKLRRHERGEWPATVEFETDEQWELVGEAGQAAETERTPKGRIRLFVHTDRENAGRREIVVRFRSTNDSPLGRIFYPNIRPVGLNIQSHLIAVSCQPPLECVPSCTPPTPAAPPADFAAGESAGEQTPQLLLDASQLEPNWYLSVRPHEAASSYEDRLSLAASKRRLRVDYRCDVTPQGADCFRWSLSVPERFDVERVAVTCGDESVPVDWTRQMPTRLAIQFARKATKPYQVELTGSVPWSAGEPMPVPPIGPPNLSQVDRVVALYRDENVLAKWQLPGDVPTIEAVATPLAPFGDSFRFVGAYRIQAESLIKTLVLVAPNRPVVLGDTLTAVARNDDAWAATFHVNLRVDRGVIDALRLKTPANWTGPFKVASAANSRIVGTTGNSTLSIRLPQPVPAGGTIQLSVSSPLTFADGEAPIAPRVALSHAGQRGEYFALPATVGGQEAAWTRRGVEPAEPPEALRRQVPAAGEVETFRVVGESINVALRPRTPRASTASVRLAETALRLVPRGGTVAVTRFVITPEGLANCVVKLPDDSDLVRLQLDGHAALARSLDPQTWRVQLGPPDLPQVLEVATRSLERSTGNFGVVELGRPTLESAGQPIPVEINLWTLHRTGAAGTARVTGGAQVTPAELAAARFDRLVSISQLATRSVIESPLVDGIHWFHSWSSRLDAAARMADSLQRQTAGASAVIRVPQPDESLVETTARYEAWLDQVSEIFAAAEWNTAALPAAAGAPLDVGNEFEADFAGQVCFISDGNEHRAQVEFVPPGMTPTESRVVVLLSLAAVGAVAFWLARRPQALEEIERWPEAGGLVLGLLAWAWLRPSLLGLLLASTSAVLLVRRIIRARKSPRHDGFNQPSESAEHLA